MNESELFPCDYNETVPLKSFQLNTLGYVVLELILGVFIGFGNILVLAAFCKFRELRTSMNVYVVALALADLTIALIALPLHIAIFVFPILKTVFFICMLRYCILIISSGSSAILLIVISIDRYLAIEKPFEYSRIMTTGKAKLISIGVLMFTISYSSLPVLGWNEWSPCGECTFTLVLPQMYLTGIVLSIIIGVVLMRTLNVKILFTANKAYREIHARIVSYPGQNSIANGNRVVRNKRAIKAILMMFCAYAICLLPFGIFILWEINSLDKTVREQYHALRIGTTLLAFINSGLNPLIYHRRIPEFNNAFRRLLGIKAKINNTSTGHDTRTQAAGPS